VAACGGGATRDRNRRRGVFCEGLVPVRFFVNEWGGVIFFFVCCSVVLKFVRMRSV